MKPNFPDKSEGERLSAEHVNALSRAAENIPQFQVASGLTMTKTGNKIAIAGPPKIDIEILRVVSRIGSRQYLGQIKWYDHETEEWKPTDDEYAYKKYYDLEFEDTWLIDSSAVGINLVEGGWVNAYWNPQRGAYIPFANNNQSLLLCQLLDDLNPKTSARALPYVGLVSADGGYRTIATLDEEHSNDEDLLFDHTLDENNMIRVYDFFYRNSTYPTVRAGSDVLALHVPYFQRYVVVNTRGY